MAGKTVTRADLAESVFRKVGLSRTESAELVETVTLPGAPFAATDDWGAQDDAVRPLPERITRAGRAFAAALARREPAAARDEFGGTPSFEEMFPG